MPPALETPPVETRAPEIARGKYSAQALVDHGGHHLHVDNKETLPDKPNPGWVTTASDPREWVDKEQSFLQENSDFVLGVGKQAKDYDMRFPDWVLSIQHESPTWLAKLPSKDNVLPI
jgi:hypothetical protein